jgi:hypothetical protein
MADDRGGDSRREFFDCRLNHHTPGIRSSKSMSKPNFDYLLTFFERWVSSACGSVLTAIKRCQKPDIYLHTFLHTAW